MRAQIAADDEHRADFSRNEYEPTPAECQQAAAKIHAAKLASIKRTKRKA